MRAVHCLAVLLALLVATAAGTSPAGVLVKGGAWRQVERGPPETTLGKYYHGLVPGDPFKSSYRPRLAEAAAASASAEGQRQTQAAGHLERAGSGLHDSHAARIGTDLRSRSSAGNLRLPHWANPLPR